jgi:hypothetical protein
MAASFYLGACGRNRREFSPSELLRRPRRRTSGYLVSAKSALIEYSEIRLRHESYSPLYEP